MCKSVCSDTFCVLICVVKSAVCGDNWCVISAWRHLLCDLCVVKPAV